MKLTLGRLLGFTFLMGLLAGCASSPEPTQRAQVRASVAYAGWQHLSLPGKAVTEYQPIVLDGRDALEVNSNASASLLRRKLAVAGGELGRLHFAWKVPALIDGSDMARRDAEDSVVRVILSFDGDRSRLSTRDHMLSELAHLMTGEPMPYATLMYVWANHTPVEEVIVNPRIDRIRKLVLESGPQRLSCWIDYQCDIAADYRRLYGEEPGALIGVAVMTDADNTQGRSEAYYGPISLTTADGRRLD